MHKCPFCKKELLCHALDIDGYNITCHNNLCHYRYRALANNEGDGVAYYTRWCVNNEYEISSYSLGNESNIRDMKTNIRVEYDFHISTDNSTIESIQNILLLN